LITLFLFSFQGTSCTIKTGDAWGLHLPKERRSLIPQNWVKQLLCLPLQSSLSS